MSWPGMAASSPSGQGEHWYADGHLQA